MARFYQREAPDPRPEDGESRSPGGVLVHLHRENTARNEPMAGDTPSDQRAASEIKTHVRYVSDNFAFLKQSLNEAVGSMRALRALRRTAEGSGPSAEAAARAVDRELANLDFLEAEIAIALAESAEGMDHIAAIAEQLDRPQD